MDTGLQVLLLTLVLCFFGPVGHTITETILIFPDGCFATQSRTVTGKLLKEMSFCDYGAENRKAAGLIPVLLLKSRPLRRSDEVLRVLEA